jgi:hypothetical protein
MGQIGVISDLSSNLGVGEAQGVKKYSKNQPSKILLNRTKKVTFGPVRKSILSTNSDINFPDSKTVIKTIMIDIEDNPEAITNKPVHIDYNPESKIIKENLFTDDERNIIRLVAGLFGTSRW